MFAEKALGTYLQWITTFCIKIDDDDDEDNGKSVSLEWFTK